MMPRPDHSQLARMLKVLSADVRVHILQLLRGRSLCVNALASRLDVTQGAVSQHLRVMRDAGLVVDQRRGYYVHYRLNEITLARWRAEIDALFEPLADNAGDCQVRAGRKQRKD
jgi:DNA-binding transcriptional ArsR family regulator